MAVVDPIAQILQIVIQKYRDQANTDATTLNTAINNELASHAHDAVGDMSPDEVFGLVDEAAKDSESSINHTTYRTPQAPDRPTVVAALTEDMKQRTAEQVALTTNKPVDAVRQSLDQNLASEAHGDFESQHIDKSIDEMVAALQSTDSSIPNLTPQQKNEITGAVLGDVRKEVSITLTNSMLPPAVQPLPGGYPISARGGSNTGATS